MIRRSRRPPARHLRSVVASCCLAVLAGCAGWSSTDEARGPGESLETSLQVAAAALAAGQHDVARRLYVSLAERFPDSPEPLLGAGYVELFVGRPGPAKEWFLKASALAESETTARAEALLGAGRAALVQGRTTEAHEMFTRARAIGPDSLAAPWVANGQAVAAALDARFAQSELHFAEALRLSPGEPRITANLVRMLISAGRWEDGAHLYAAYDPSRWQDGDGPALSLLIAEARRQHPEIASGEPGTRVAHPRLEDPPGALSSLRRANASPGRSRAASGEPASLARPPPVLEMRLSAFAPLPSQVHSAEPHSLWGRPSLALRLDAWPGPVTPPVMNDASHRASAGPPLPEPPRLPPVAAVHRADRSGSGVPGVGVGPSAPDPPVSPPPDTLTLTLGQGRRLHLDRPATAVSVASPEFADVQILAPNVLYAIGKGVGSTSVAVLSEGEWTEEWIVSVELDLEPLREELAAAPGLGGVRAQHLARGVSVTGEVASAEAADRALRIVAATLPEGVSLTNELRITGPQQVNLEVQIAEVNRSATEELGVNWEAFRIRGESGFGFRIGRVGSTPPITGALPAAIGVPAAMFDGRIAPAFHFGRQTGRTRIGAMVDALATAGLANVLARPNITAVSGESASFFSGGEFPLPTGFDSGVLVFEYKKYGVLLDFVPTVVDDERIVLTVRPEVSEPSRNQSVQVAQGVAVPVINVRRAATTVEVGDGESIVIAGLFRNRTNTVETGVPGLKDVPLVGALFGHSSNRFEELELIVIVTARLVTANPSSSADATGESAASPRADEYHY